MAISVRIPTPLRQYTDGQANVLAVGDTVGDTLENLVSTYPGLKSRLYGDNGKLRRYVQIFANSQQIQGSDGFSTAVKDGDKIEIVPAIAGGAR